MRRATRVIHSVGRVLGRFGKRIVECQGIKGTWIDVGAHHGETTLQHAYRNPGLKIYALEPNLSLATKLMGRSPNFLVIPMAVSEKDGTAALHVNAYDAASSLLPFNESALRAWIGGEKLKVDSVITVPTIRLDTLMQLAEIQCVDFLKIDTQGMDLAVVRSAGSRLRDITKITLEVDLNPVPLYSGAPSKDQVLAFLNEAGFLLVAAEKQTSGQEENLTFVRKA